VRFIDWFPYYQDIRQQFGYSTEKDQNAASILSNMLKKKSLDLKMLQRKIAGRHVMVIGAGDSLIQNIVPTLRRIIGTTQVMPVENVYNFGGFTDGDRCVFLADEFGAEEIVLVGMEFGDHIGEHSKKSVENIQLKRDKMKVGKRLLEMLAKRSRSRLFDTSRKPIRGFSSLSI
jgi:uncharacterized Rossmann fold enzyme